MSKPRKRASSKTGVLSSLSLDMSISVGRTLRLVGLSALHGMKVNAFGAEHSSDGTTEKWIISGVDSANRDVRVCITLGGVANRTTGNDT